MCEDFTSTGDVTRMESPADAQSILRGKLVCNSLAARTAESITQDANANLLARRRTCAVVFYGKGLFPMVFSRSGFRGFPNTYILSLSLLRRKNTGLMWQFFFRTLLLYQFLPAPQHHPRARGWMKMFLSSNSFNSGRILDICTSPSPSPKRP